MADENLHDEYHNRPQDLEQPADVALDVHELSIEKVEIQVDELEAQLALNVQLADLLQIQAGVNLHLESVDVSITGVEADARLRVRLDEVARILALAFRAIENNPDVFREALSGSGGNALDSGGSALGGGGESGGGGSEGEMDQITDMMS